MGTFGPQEGGGLTPGVIGRNEAKRAGIGDAIRYKGGSEFSRKLRSSISE